MGYSIHNTHIGFFENPTDRHPVATFFAKRMATETRIQDSNPAPALALFQSPPSHPIHALLMDNFLAKGISDKFRQAFGMDLTVLRAGGGSFPLFVGSKPTLRPGEDELSKSFVLNLQSSNIELHQQGDGMRSFASVLLHTLTSSTHSIQFLDEPEAFLHPPQARLLGRFISENLDSNKQLFISTHSTDMLNGLIDGATDRIRVIRLKRDGSVNKITELKNDQIKELAGDTLTRFSRVLDGIFFEHVIVCESDADCMFYHAALNATIHNEQQPDVLFTHSAGKHRMLNLITTLRSLDVPTSVIADIDALNDELVIKGLFTRLGGNWDEIKSSWSAFNQAITSMRPSLDAAQVVKLIQDQIDFTPTTGAFPPEKERAIKNIFKSVSPWSAIKQGGRSAVPAGEPTKHFNYLLDRCGSVGLWIVPVGELEGFCKSLGSHGPAFVERVLAERSLQHDPELREARAFISRIWDRAAPKLKQPS